jgi:hypothetical protein
MVLAILNKDGLGNAVDDLFEKVTLLQGALLSLSPCQHDEALFAPKAQMGDAE